MSFDYAMCQEEYKTLVMQENEGLLNWEYDISGVLK
jgi:hypothetical protein